MKRGLSGKYHKDSTSGEDVMAFIPNALPPKPEIDWNHKLRLEHETALLALGKLEGMSSILPAPSIFIYSYIRKEAVLSSQIEGTQSTLTDLFKFENNQNDIKNLDVVEVSNYVKALMFALEEIKKGMPICVRLLKKTHEILLDGSRGKSQQPGEVRTSQNWIGGTRPGNAEFVPPPHLEVPACLSNLEKFINTKDEQYTTLTRAALAHVQFETIHPFLDGNGRLGRLLILLIMIQDGILKSPLLYISLYLKLNRSKYYSLLTEVRKEGDWEAWLEFFFKAVATSATNATDTAQALVRLFEKDKAAVENHKRSTHTLLRVYNHIQQKPYIDANEIATKIDLAYSTALNAINVLEEIGIISEVTGQKRNRLYCYKAYISELENGTNPL